MKKNGMSAIFPAMPGLPTLVLFLLILPCTVFLLPAEPPETGGSVPADLTLSVLYFESLDRREEYLWMEKGIADSLISELSGADGLVLVEREQLQKVLEEMTLQLSGLTRDAGAAKLGYLLNADRLVMGSYTIQGEMLRINCRAVETETGRVLFSVSGEGALAGFTAVQRRLASEILRNLGLPAGDPLVREEPPPVTALAYYYRGLDLFDRKEYSRAAELMENALRESPGFAGASMTLEECYRFLQDFRRARQLRELNALYREIELLMRRLNRRPFITYGELVSRAAAEGRDLQALAERLKEDISWFRGDTPAQVLWNAQIVLFRIAGKLQDEFQNAAGAENTYLRIISAADKGREIFPEDPFLPEILYQEILARYMLRDWPELERSCLVFMTQWPDFRMISGVENFYEQALERREHRGTHD